MRESLHTRWVGEPVGGRGVSWVRRRALGLIAALSPLTLAALLATSVPVASADSCPNSAFRQGASANLPDCRAYELVTPSYKEGFEAFALGGSSDGSSLVVLSLGSFFGVGDQPVEIGAAYGLSRGVSGWITTPFAPPASQFRVCPLNGGASGPVVSLDARRVLYELHTASQSQFVHEIYVRQPDGAFDLVGPVFSGAETAGPIGIDCFSALPNGRSSLQVGQSGDLSHVVFQVGSSLYEYAGTGNTAPILVGVRGGRGSTSLVSQCGTELPAALSPLGSKYNVSESGATVFFESNACEGGPPVRELFARINESETVAISEPTAADCAACNTGSPAGAAFQAASADGSKAFFITSQPLLNGDGDGTPDLYEYDFGAPAGQRIVQVSGGGHGDGTPGSGANVQGVAAVSRDGSHAYFVAQGVLSTDPNSQGRVAQAGQNNLYVYERDAQFPSGRTAFIATLLAGETEPSSQTTPDGRFLVFISAADLTADDTSSARQAFEYDAQSGVLVRVSIGQNGFNHNGNTNATNNLLFLSGLQGLTSVSTDGQYVFFESSTGLTPQAIDDPAGLYNNVYEYHNGNVWLISDGRDRSSLIRLLGASASGGDVFFETVDSLVSQDGDTQVDIYDARIGGGFPVASSPGCGGEACQGALSSAPAGQTLGSSTVSGAGNRVVSPSVKKARKPRARKRHRPGRHRKRATRTIHRHDSRRGQ